MKKFASIKTRITIWYTLLMLVLVSVVLVVVGTLSYRLATDSIENRIKSQVTQVFGMVGFRHRDVFFHPLDGHGEFRNVSIYDDKGEYVAGQYSYGIEDVPFRQGEMRREIVDGEEYIVYDMFKPERPGENSGYWIRGAESVNYTQILGESAFLVLGFVIPLIILLTALGGYFITKKAFMPVKDIIRTANEINISTDIKKRIQISPDAKPDELYNLSVTLNRMLDKIESLIVREKQFTSDASHELRTPVSVILAQGEYLMEIADTEKEKELAGNIVSKAKQMSKLISALLLIARIDSHRQKLNREKLDLSVIVDIAVDGLEQMAREKSISVMVDVAENTIIYADEALLLSAVTNLVSNAIKYGREGGKVEIYARKHEKCTELVVADNGVGIAEENLRKIWSRFFRIDDVRNDEYGSYGLGLSVVKSIIELHGGSVSVRSAEGEGTKFTVTLNN